MTLVQLLRDFCAKWGLPAPSAIVGSTDATYTQMLSIAKESVRSLQNLPWVRAKQRVTWSMLASEDQGILATVFGAGFRGLVPATVWDDTSKIPLFGPVGDPSWQLYKQFAANPWGQYKIMNGHFYILPAPTAGHTMSAMIVSKYLVSDSGGTLKEYYTADDDSLVLGDEVFMLDFEWRWLKQKGEDWVDSKAIADAAIRAQLVSDGGLPTFALDSGSGQSLRPGIIVPGGSWPV